MASDVITATWLRQQRACEPMVKRFMEVFPAGAPINQESEIKARAAILDLQWLAQNPNTYTSALDWLSNFTASWVRVKVAQNPTTPAAVLDKLSRDMDVWVRGEIARNPDSPYSALDLLSRDPNSWVRSEVVLNSAVPDAILDFLSHDENPVVRRAYIYKTGHH